jgi:dCTP deaminase
VPEKTIHEGSGMSFGLSYAGYDIRIKQDVSISKGGFALASTVEKFTMPNDVVGIVHDKSSLARKGLSVFNTVIEPGWEGYLTLELVNHGYEMVGKRFELQLFAGQPIAQIIFHRLDHPADGYKGKYQNQPDKPVEAIFETVPGELQRDT